MRNIEIAERTTVPRRPRIDILASDLPTVFLDRRGGYP
jgi:hypothetical protein